MTALMRYMDTEGGQWIATAGTEVPTPPTPPDAMPPGWIPEPVPGPCDTGMRHSFHPDPEMRQRQGFDAGGHPPNCPAADPTIRAEHALWLARRQLPGVARPVTRMPEPSRLQLDTLRENGAADDPHARRAYYWLVERYGPRAEVSEPQTHEALIATGIDVRPVDDALQLVDRLEVLLAELRTALRTSDRPNQAPDSASAQVSPPSEVDTAADTDFIPAGIPAPAAELLAQVTRTPGAAPCDCGAQPGQGHLLRCAVWA